MVDQLKYYKPIGVIGSGSMGTAVMRGLLSSGILEPRDIVASKSRFEDLEKLREQGVQVLSDNREVVQSSKIVLLAVKPNMIELILKEIQPVLAQKLVISVAAGVQLNIMEKIVQCPLIRVMPNTAVLIGEGCAVMTRGSYASIEDINACKTIFGSVCKICEEVSEENIDSMIGISGSGIAFMYMVVEALADAGVKMGLSRSLSTALASQTMVGAGKMVQITGKHPMLLKDHVTSPGGTTICGVVKLEELRLRHALISAAEVTKEKAKSMAAAHNNI